MCCCWHICEAFSSLVLTCFHPSSVPFSLGENSLFCFLIILNIVLTTPLATSRRLLPLRLVRCLVLLVCRPPSFPFLCFPRSSPFFTSALLNPFLISNILRYSSGEDSHPEVVHYLQRSPHPRRLRDSWSARSSSSRNPSQF